MCKKSMKISKSTTLSIIFLVLFLILLIILPMAFFYIMCILIIAGVPNLIIEGIILHAHLLYLLLAIPQWKLNRKIFIFEVIVTIIMFICTLIICFYINK